MGIQELPAALVDVVARYRAQGYARVKLKVKPDWLVTAVACGTRSRIVGLQVDANSAFTLADAPRLDDLDARACC